MASFVSIISCKDRICFYGLIIKTADLIQCNDFQLQNIFSNVCGLYCILYLLQTVRGNQMWVLLNGAPTQTHPHPPLDLHSYPHTPTSHVIHPHLISLTHPDLPIFVHTCPYLPKLCSDPPTLTYRPTGTHTHTLDISLIPA